jgi:hypothetical protein
MANRAPFGTYNFDNVALAIDGRRVVGLAEGDGVIDITPTTDVGKPIVGADGSSLVAFSADQSATMVVKLLITSPFNAYLRQKVTRARAGALTGVTFPIGFTDMSNGLSGGAVDATVIKEPPTTRGAAPGEQEWHIFLPVWEATDITVNR